jgi:hypothetical protein
MAEYEPVGTAIKDSEIEHDLGISAFAHLHRPTAIK